MLVTVPKLAERPAPPADHGSNKRKAKVRSAWISFAGRIVAQILGAAATVGFALVVFNGQPEKSGSIAEARPAQSARTGTTAGTNRPTVAVLPFHVYASATEHTHIAGGLTDLLVTELANGGRLSVTSTTSSMRFQSPASTLPEIGRQLGVSHIVEGSITIAGKRARINAQLIDAASDQHVWARSYDAQLDDVLALEASLASEIAREVRAALSAATVNTDQR
jgi:TolB-like protein